MDYCKFVTAEGGLVGYMDAKSAGATVSGPFSDQFTYHPSTMSALGICLRIFATHDGDDPFLSLAAKRIIQDLPTVSESHSSIDYYYWYCGSLALNQFDGPDSPRKTGKYWNPWNRAMVDAVISLQDHTPQACSNGGWILSDRWGNYSGTGPLFNTAMNVRTLEIYYAYPNSFGTSASVGTRAPDLQLIDDQGASFSLLRYRGSVVLLDLWTPNARDFDSYLESRGELATRLQGKRFVLVTLGFASDSTQEGNGRLPRPDERKVATWRCSQLLRADDPIRSQLGFQSNRGIVVVDSNGTIRYAGPNWHRALIAVERAQDEVDEATGPK
jgi:hypothetical protein